ncbi:MAG: MATE family efflux transporter [Clostridiales bacterium]|nr:MATE family efflux transporter [Clostridiales bacterium]
MSIFRRRFIGDKAFYKTVLGIMIPVIIQNSVTNFVNLLDNIMVGQLGTEQMSGVAIANQLHFIFALCIFGGLAGPGIFGAQFYGAKDTEGLRNTFRIKIWFSVIITAIALIVFTVFQTPLVHLFLQGDGDASQAALMLDYAHEYIQYMLLGHIPFAIAMSYGSTFRETGETMLPMKAGILAVLTNLLFNWLLIFGNLGFPAWGVKGAAIATVISRFVELGGLVFAAHRQERFSFFHHIYKTMKVPFNLLKKVVGKSMPLLVNEFLWSLGMAALTQAYSMRGLLVLSALNIASTASNLFNVFFLGVGNAVAVLVGHSLGAGKLQKARADVWKLMFLAFTLCIVVGAVLAAFSGLFPQLYNVDLSAKEMAAFFILVSAIMMPIHAVTHSSYFTLRSGGSSLITFLFDSAFTWLLLIPVTQALVHWTSLPIKPLYALTQGTNLVKFIVGVLLVKSGVWQRNIVEDAAAAPALD